MPFFCGYACFQVLMLSHIHEQTVFVCYCDGASFAGNVSAPVVVVNGSTNATREYALVCVYVCMYVVCV